MIELITGRSGSGKSELLYRYIREKCADKAILIVNLAGDSANRGRMPLDEKDSGVFGQSAGILFLWSVYCVCLV